MNKSWAVSVKVETHESITDKFQTAAQGGKGPDILLWAHDRIGEWADAGLIKPLKIKEDFKAAFLPMAWEAVTHTKRVWGYPLALECVSLICNKKLVAGKPPTQLSEFPALSKELKANDQKFIAIMWEYNSPYFSFPFLASAGAYSFKRTESGYDLKDIGLDNAGAVKGLKAIINLINENVLPRGSTQSVMNQKTGQRPARYHGRPWVSIIQVCLMLVRYEQRPEDRETEGLADQAQSSRDPFQALSLEQPVGNSGFRL